MIAIIDYQMGNLQSVFNAVSALGQKAVIVEKLEQLAKAEAIILPGVGAFGQGMANLKKLNFIEALEYNIQKAKKPFLGICLGMQVLAKKSYELGCHQGLGWLDFEVKKISPRDKSLRVPHMGWNDLTNIKQESRLFHNIRQPAVVYFVHSFNLEPLNQPARDSITSQAWHGQDITASLEKGNIFGAQFHPEKSQNTGLALLKNFISLI